MAPKCWKAFPHDSVATLVTENPTCQRWGPPRPQPAGRWSPARPVLGERRTTGNTGCRGRASRTARGRRAPLCPPLPPGLAVAALTTACCCAQRGGLLRERPPHPRQCMRWPRCSSRSRARPPPLAPRHGDLQQRTAPPPPSLDLVWGAKDYFSSNVIYIHVSWCGHYGK